jgi:hypothetical protein
VQSQEQAADSRVERLAGRAEGRREAAEKAKEAVGARPIHITSQLGLVAQRAAAACVRAARRAPLIHKPAARAPRTTPGWICGLQRTPRDREFFQRTAQCRTRRRFSGERKIPRRARLKL